MVHVADPFLIDAAKCYVDALAIDLLARMHGSSYGRVTNLFAMTRLDPDAALAAAKRLVTEE
ncbi:MAG: hypothetical protein ACRYHQ_00555 [Janthinobacterium lividum]